MSNTKRVTIYETDDQYFTYYKFTMLNEQPKEWNVPIELLEQFDAAEKAFIDASNALEKFASENDPVAEDEEEEESK